MEGRSFIHLPGTMVALYMGVPVAVFERKGKVFRVFDDTLLSEVLRAFVHDYEKRCIYPELNRLVVKQYPVQAAKALSSAGFLKEIQDYVMYRGRL